MELDHAELQEMLANDPYMLLVDVRDEEEFDAGHIPGAGNMSVDDIVDCLFDEALGERGPRTLSRMAKAWSFPTTLRSSCSIRMLASDRLVRASIWNRSAM